MSSGWCNPEWPHSREVETFGFGLYGKLFKLRHIGNFFTLHLNWLIENCTIVTQTKMVAKKTSKITGDKMQVTHTNFSIAFGNFTSTYYLIYKYTKFIYYTIDLKTLLNRSKSKTQPPIRLTTNGPDESTNNKNNARNLNWISPTERFAACTVRILLEYCTRILLEICGIP